MPFAQTTPPSSAFEIFCKNEQSSYQKKNPKASPSEMEAIMKKAWETLAIKKKDHYNELSKKEIETYTSSYYF